MSGQADLDAMIARVRALDGFVKRAAPAVAHALEAEMHTQISAGTDPDGKAWQRTQDGQQPLRKAANDLRVVVIGAKVFAALKGHVARHNNGTARGGIARPVLPGRGLPTRYAQAIRSALTKEFEA